MNDASTLRLARAAAMHAAGGDHDFLMRLAVDDLIDRLSLVKREFAHGLAAFGATDGLARAMEASGQVAQVTRLEQAIHADGAEGVCVTDLHKPDFGASLYDLAIVPFALHFTQDLPVVLMALHRALKPDGLLLAVVPGPNTLGELRRALIAGESAASGGAGQRVDAFISLQDAGALLQKAGFALPVVDRDMHTVRYDTIRALARDLRGMGANRPAGSGPSLTKAALAEAQAAYERNTGGDRLEATVEFIAMQGWVPHESQQKPAKRGSATVSLKDVLKPGSGTS